MRISRYLIGALLAVAAAAGCGDDERTVVNAAPTSTPEGLVTVSPAATESPTAPPTATSTGAAATATAISTGEPTSTAVQPPPTNTPVTLATGTPGTTPTGTPAGTASGPIISYLGISTADDRPITSFENDSAGRPIFARELGTGLNLIVEVRPGPDGRAPGTMAFSDTGLPDLQLLVSRPLGDGSPAVCDVDIESGEIGGVPGTAPPVFSAADAINDLGCRVNDGAGNPLSRGSSNLACTRFETGDFSFVDPSSRAQFCLPIAHAWEFPVGDTVVTARMRSVTGSLGETRQMVVRVGRGTVATSTPTSTRLPTPTPTPVPPVITYFGIAAADDRVVLSTDVDGDGRDIYGRLIGHAFSLVIEAAPGLGGRPVGIVGYSDGVSLPDLNLLVDRDLGDGSPVVCDVDIENSIFGGIPGIDPPLFSGEAGVVDAINDLGCRLNDGTGAPIGRTASSACTRDAFGGFTFLNPASTVQFCLPIARAWRYQDGDTITAARVRSIDGATSAVEEIVVRVEAAEHDECAAEGDLGERVFSTVAAESALRTAGVEGDVSSEWVATPARICAGPGESDLHPLRLLSDFTVGMALTNGDALCARFYADGSDGVLDCAGSAGHGVRYTVDAADGAIDLDVELGDPSGGGAATMTVPVAFRVLPGPVTSDECFGAEFGGTTTLALTTADAEAEVLNPTAGGTLAITAMGDNFDCDNWATEDGPGTFAMPVAALTGDDPIVESASIFLLDD